MPPPLTLDVVETTILKTTEYKRPKRKLAFLLYSRTPVWVLVTAKVKMANGFESYRVEYDVEDGAGEVKPMCHLVPCDLIGDSVPDIAVQMMGLYNHLVDSLPDEDANVLKPWRYGFKIQNERLGLGRPLPRWAVCRYPG